MGTSSSEFLDTYWNHLDIEDQIAGAALSMDTEIPCFVSESISMVSEPSSHLRLKWVSTLTSGISTTLEAAGIASLALIKMIRNSEPRNNDDSSSDESYEEVETPRMKLSSSKSCPELGKFHL
ncbi:unnamed protein product [Blepharisma stoltei]|uniref:VAN3-binding protein-like auxin canalisation domain-containing protein n=1 Tax=Blepharisma stoltei TaxID=1481888 RepID=A0AAU9IY40_9CILI|nr:unnamed protein product [Blepharisma stoltei]